MSENALKALEYALENEVPFKPKNILIVNPSDIFEIDGGITVIQPFKPWYNKISAHKNWKVFKSWKELEGGYDAALILMPKQKDQARGWLARAFQLLFVLFQQSYLKYYS